MDPWAIWEEFLEPILKMIPKMMMWFIEIIKISLDNLTII
jgi:hypothetical protein